MEPLREPGLVILRVPTDGTPDHPNFLYGLAALWVFGAGNGALSATAHDDYSGTPFLAELDWELGEPLEDARQRGNGWSRRFSHGWAAVNLNAQRHRKITYDVPSGLLAREGPAPARVTLLPHRGAIFRARD